jgi:hypothetical protein
MNPTPVESVDMSVHRRTRKLLRLTAVDLFLGFADGD